MESKTHLPDIKVGGLTRLTSIDFPGHLAAVIFTQGCLWRCRYCYNTSLLDPRQDAVYDWEEVLFFLKRRRCLLDGIVFSGGEPTFWPSLPDYMHQIRRMGFRVALHTSGAYPDRLSLIIRENLVDWIGLDIKALFNDYKRITRIRGSGILASQSLQILLNSKVNREIRITVHPMLFTRQDLLDIANQLSLAGVSDLVLQTCRAKETLDPTLRKESVQWEDYLKDCVSLMSKVIPTVVVR
jgi:pyruvate formate lyase activating enzyme